MDRTHQYTRLLAANAYVRVSCRFPTQTRNIKLRVIPKAVLWVTPLPPNKVPGDLQVDSNYVSILFIMSVTVIG